MPDIDYAAIGAITPEDGLLDPTPEGAIEGIVSTNFKGYRNLAPFLRGMLSDEPTDRGLFGELGAGAARGALKKVSSRPIAAAAAFSEVVGAPQGLSNWLTNVAAKADVGTDLAAPRSEEDGLSVRQILGDIGEAGAGLAMDAALAAGVGAVTAGAGALPTFILTSGIDSAGETYLDAVNETGDTSSASTEAAAVGVMTAGTSAIPGMAILNRTPVGRILGRKIAQQAVKRLGTVGAAAAGGAVAEGGQELVQAFGQELAKELVRYDRDLSWQLAKDLTTDPDRLGSYFYQAGLGVLVGGPVAGAAQGARSAKNRWYRVKGGDNDGMIVPPGTPAVSQLVNGASEIEVLEGEPNVLKADDPKAKEMFEAVRGENPEADPTALQEALLQKATEAGYQGVQDLKTGTVFITDESSLVTSGSIAIDESSMPRFERGTWLLGPDLEARIQQDITSTVEATPAPKSSKKPLWFDEVADISQATPEQIADNLAAQIADPIANGVAFDEAAARAGFKHINFSRLNIADDLKVVLQGFERVAENQINAEIGDVKSLEATKMAALRYLQDQPDLLRAVQSDAGNVQGIPARLVAVKMLRNAAASKASEAARMYKSGDKSSLRTLLDASNVAVELDRMGGIIQKEAARTVSAGRINTGDSAKADSMIDAITGRVSEAQVVTDVAVDVLSPKTPSDPATDPATDASTDPSGEASPESVPETPQPRPGDVLKPLIEDPDLGPPIIDSIIDDTDSGQVPHVFRILGHANEKWFKKSLGVFLEYWRGALLSGIKTFNINWMSNAMNTMVMPAETFLGGVWMRDSEQVKGSFRMAHNLLGVSWDILNLTRASQARTAAMKSWSTESPIFDALTSSEQTHQIPGTVGRAFRSFNFRPMTTMDELFKQLNARAFLRTKAQALLERPENAATRDALAKANKLGAFIDAYESKFFDADGRAALDGDGDFVSPDAVAYARDATWTSELLEGSLASKVQNLRTQHPWVQLFLPFFRTPVNLLTKSVRMTPGLQFAAKDFHARWNSKDPNVRARVRGEAMLGAAVWTVAVGAAAAGKLTGGGPSDREEREILLATGWRPYSLIVDGPNGKEYIEYRRADPYSSILGLAADFAEIGDRASTSDLDELGVGMLVALSRNLTSKSYLTGVAELGEILAKPDQNAAAILRNRVSSLVPALIGGGTSAFDASLRDARTMMDAIKARLPVLSGGVRPRRNLLGEPIQPPAGFLPFVDTSGRDPVANAMRMLSPAAYSKQVDDEVKLELARLAHGFGQPSQTIEGINLTLFKNAQGQDAYDRLIELTGTLPVSGRTLAQDLDSLIKSPRYQRLEAPSGPDYTGRRIDEVRAVIGKYRDRARRQLFKEFPDLKRMVDLAKREDRTGNRSGILNQFK